MYIKITVGKKNLMWGAGKRSQQPIVGNLFEAIGTNDLTKMEYLLKALGTPNVFGSIQYQQEHAKRNIRWISMKKTNLVLPLIYAMWRGSKKP